MRADVHSFLELAVDYSHAGLWDDAIAILSLVPTPGAGEPAGTAMVDYYLGYFWGEKGDRARQLEFYELDALYERAGAAHDKRIATLEKHRATIEKRDDAISRLVLLYVQTGRYDDAGRLLAERHFNVWEGSRGLRDAYEDVYLLKGRARFRASDYHGALKEYQKALEFPLNLENAWPYRGGRMPAIFYFIATAHEALGDAASARQFYDKAAEAQQQETWSDLRYYEAMALRKLGKDEQAGRLLSGLMDFASVEPGSGVDFFSKFGEREPLNVRQARLHYLRGLVHEGRGDAAASRAEFEKALALDVNQLWARVHLGR